jgi:DNA polymerase III sliding clamp (beta) subunit (PCNA family)
VLVATDGHRLAAASTPAPSAAPLHDMHLAGPTAERLHALVEEAIKVARPRGRGAAAKAAPLMHLEITPGSSRQLVVRTELFTFAAAHTGGSFPPYHRVVPSPDTLDMICVVSARELIDALKPSAKGQVRIEFGAPLVIRSVADADEPEMSAIVRDVFFEGPRRRTRLRVALLLPALESIAASDNYVALATGSEALGPVIITRWQPDTLPKNRRDALASAREAMQTHNLALVMPMRE